MKFIERFWSKVNFNGSTPTHVKVIGACWEWNGAIKINGYGHVNFRGHTCDMAHRIAWMMVHGDPENLFVLHRCDNRACVNTNHLFLGTSKDNAQDAIEKGRHAVFKLAALSSAKTHCPHGHPYIEGNVRINSVGRRECKTCYERWYEGNKSRRRNGRPGYNTTPRQAVFY